MNQITISNELDAINFFESYLEHPELINPDSILVEGWDKFRIHLTGDKFHNSITPSVMKGIIDLQQSLYEAFALAVYNDKNVSRLTKAQKKHLEIQVVITEGSTNLDIDINALFMGFVNETVGKMTAGQAMLIFVFFITAYFGQSSWKSWMDKKQAIREKELDTETQKHLVDSLSENNRRVVDVLEKVAASNEKARAIYAQSDETRNRLVRSTRYADEININNLTEITGERAEELTRQPRLGWEVVRLDGRYRLLAVNSSSTLERKVKIRNLETGREITASLEDNTLDNQHLQRLGSAEWGLHPATLKVKAKMKLDQVKDAVIISVDNIEEDIKFDDSEDRSND